MKRLISRTFSSLEECYGDCEVAVLIITDELAKTILARGKRMREVQEKDADLRYLGYFDSNVMFFLQEDLDPSETVGFTDATVAILEEGNWIELPEAFTIDESKTQRIEMGTMIVYDDQICFEYRPKHADLTVETSSLSYNEVEACIGKGG